MNKNLLLSCFLFCGMFIIHAQTIYEVGASRTYKKLGDVLNATVIGASTDTEFIINMDEGIYTEGTGSNNVAFTLGSFNLANKKITITGAGADKTIIQRSADSLIVVWGVANSPGRMFNGATGLGGFELVCEKITFRNIGQTYHNTNGGVVEVTGTGQTYSFKNCMFRNIYSRQGPIGFFNPAAAGDLNSFTMEDCFVEKSGTIYRGTAPVGLIGVNSYGANITVKNTTFMDNNFSHQDVINEDNFSNNKVGQVLNFDTNKAAVTDISNILFENCNIIKSNLNAPIENMGIMIKVDKRGSGSINLNLKNVVSVANSRTGSPDCDLYFDPSKITPTITNSVFNVVKDMADDAAITTLTGATIDAAATYTSSTVDFEMDGGLPKIFVHDNGVKYLKKKETYTSTPSLLDKEVPLLSVFGEMLHILGINAKDRISVYNLSGSLVKEIVSDSSSAQVQLTCGMYIVKVNGYAAKVVI